MTTVSPTHYHGVNAFFGFMSKSFHSALKGFFCIIECIVGLAILVTVILFIVVATGFLLNSILF